MTTTPTVDVRATADQVTRLVEVGCEIVRVTVPTRADCDAIPEIRRILRARRIEVPLVADVHFTPALAMRVVEHVDKVRINPGNFADKKRFEKHEYSDEDYERELERIESTFAPLVRRCRELGVAMRIGTNHGSLSDRILNRYGDTPEGMVESALEFVRVCERHDFHEIVLSMKASNPVVVLRAVRTLVGRMDRDRMDYPLHLGVTEAGDGEDGRIKAAIGTGALLDEGIGDTVRVSLTEDPLAEIPVAQALVAPYNARDPESELGPARVEAVRTDEAEHANRGRRPSDAVTIGTVRIGGDAAVAVEVPLCAAIDDPNAIAAELDELSRTAELRPEIVSIDVSDRAAVAALETLLTSVLSDTERPAVSARWTGPLVGLDDELLGALVRVVDRVHVPVGTDERMERAHTIARACEDHRTAVLLEFDDRDGDADAATRRAVHTIAAARSTGCGNVAAAICPALAPSPLAVGRLLAQRLDDEGLDIPIIALDRPGATGRHPLLGPSSAIGGLLCDGIGDAVHVVRSDVSDSCRVAFGILQCARVRMTRTEFIACPSCGRTLFDLEETTARIKRRTQHLRGVKIAIMGCVVNGPGEMADADFGYVGWGSGRIALFVGHRLVEKDVPVDQADERLVRLIREHGRWSDPPVER